MSRLLLWTLSLFSAGAVSSVIAVWTLGCTVTQSHSLAVIGVAAWTVAIAAVLGMTLREASAGRWLAAVLGAGALLVGLVCLLLDVIAFQISDLCGPWEWNV